MSLNRKKTYEAEAVINAYRFIKHGTDDNEVAQAAAATDSIIGISDELGAETIGDRVDVIKEGQALLKLGGTVTKGGLGTSDANGKGVACSPASGVNNRHGCIFEESGVDGDIVVVTVCLGATQGA